jgi:hypothetical protein
MPGFMPGIHVLKPESDQSHDALKRFVVNPSRF